MPEPVYRTENVKPAYHLRYTWSGWPTNGTIFPACPDEAFFEDLDAAWQTDRLCRLETTWTASKIQFVFSTVPQMSPTLFTARVKGRLQHALRLAGSSVKFSRKVAFRGIGNNQTDEVEQYVARQVEKESFVDPEFSHMLQRFTRIDSAVNLADPSPTSSGRYWYNLHLVLVVAGRGRLRVESDFEKLCKSVSASARKHGYKLAVRAFLPDHFHVAMRGNIDESPEDIAMSLMNNTAYAMGQVEIWQAGYYVGTFSEYDVRAIANKK